MAGSTSETPVLDLLASMTADSLEASSLDSETLMLVRIAALAAIDVKCAIQFATKATLSLCIIMQMNFRRRLTVELSRHEAKPSGRLERLVICQ